MSRAGAVLRWFIPVKEHEVQPVLFSFASLFSVSAVGRRARTTHATEACVCVACSWCDRCVVTCVPAPVCPLRWSVQILASFFLLLPLREDAAISLGEPACGGWAAPHAQGGRPRRGAVAAAAARSARAHHTHTRPRACRMRAGTSTLPVLFASSLVVTVLVTPALSAYLNSAPNRCARAVACWAAATAAAGQHHLQGHARSADVHACGIVCS
jgi:hypothetical protein